VRAWLPPPLVAPTAACSHPDTLLSVIQVQSNLHTDLQVSAPDLRQLTCRKLANYQLPFGWYLASHVFLWGFIITLPLTAVVWMQSWLMALASSFIVVGVYATLHEIALQMEEPFSWYPNMIPLSHRQYSLNERLIAMRHARRPVTFADYLADVHDGAGYERSKDTFKCRVRALLKG
jgi:predicted membrane chloride channel (bestrophin family)